MMFDFITTTYGKWILAGEHAVLRGHSALVFPIAEKNLTLHYNSASKEVNADFNGQHGETLHLLFWSILEHGLKLLNKSLNQIKGSFLLTNNISIGVGMGASAALCVAVTRWFIFQGWINKKQEFLFAKSLEDLCHGKSSGLDIVGVSESTAQFFQDGNSQSLTQKWKPYWYLSFCGQQGFTSPCIAKVNELWAQDPSFARKCDQNMQESVLMAKEALEINNAIDLLASSINLAAACFKDWGLINSNMLNHIKQLEDLGAIAVKPTGSGSGGYLISLWRQALSDEVIYNNENDWIKI